MNVASARDSIVLNAKELDIQSATVTSNGQEQKAIVTYNHEEMTLALAKKVQGEIEIDIVYEGTHNDHLYGFYKSSYVHNGKTEYLLSSQFEAPNARAAFPCLDEPEFKATFDVTMLIDEGFEAVSNMPIEKTEKMGTKKIVTFQTTPKMSTYLLYLGVGRYDSVEGNSNEVHLRILAREGNGKYTSLPLDYTKKLFADLQDYFKVAYPLPKLDLLGIPDFAAGAMENWGAMTFRETTLLGDERTSISGKQRIAEVVAHEIAHQWFGDLVTMRWWDDMWLNESFATFMAYKSVDRVFPEWKIMLEYYPDTLGSALVADGMKNTHPISVEVNTAGEIEELFDAIGYNKGGSVLLMLEDFVGPDAFRQGLVRYLEAHAYSNATKTDLWTAIEEECRNSGNTAPVIEIMEDWITREGFPIIHVKRNGKDFELTQERFSISGNTPGVWKIPVSYLSENGEGKVVMDKEKTVIKNAGSWIKINYRQAGFYRVSYEKENIAILGKMVAEKKFGALDVWGLENDLFALVRSGKRPLVEYVTFVHEYYLDCTYPANVNVSEHLGWLNAIGQEREFMREARELSVRFHRKIIETISWEAKHGESSVDTKLRALAIMELGRLKSPDATSWARNTLEAYAKGTSIDPNLRAAVFYINAYDAPNQAMFDRFLDIYKGNASPEEKVIALQALGMISDVELLGKALELSATQQVRLQDSLSIPGVVGGPNPQGRKLYRDWAMKNWKHFLEKYSPSSHMLRACASAFGSLADEESRKKVETFFNDKSNMRDDIRIAVKQSLEKMTANIRFIEKNSA